MTYACNDRLNITFTAMKDGAVITLDWLTFNSKVLNGYSWEWHYTLFTDDLAQSGVYFITAQPVIEGYYKVPQITEEFEITLIDPCKTAVLMFNEQFQQSLDGLTFTIGDSELNIVIQQTAVNQLSGDETITLSAN